MLFWFHGFLNLEGVSVSSYKGVKVGLGHILDPFLSLVGVVDIFVVAIVGV